MLDYYPSHTHLLNNFERIAGHHAGMVESQLLMTTRRRGAPRLNICTNQMPHYERIVVGDTAKIQYHLAGYGSHREESIVKLFGESIERYALLMASQTWGDKVVYRSYRQMAQEYDVVPWEYLQLYTEADYEVLQRTTKVRPFTQDDVIGWLECSSLVRQGERTWTPAQCLSIGYRVREDLGEVCFVSGFSKGSAAHVSYAKALEGAILESVEADAFMLNWYTDHRARELHYDHLGFMRFVDRTFASTPYDLTLYDLSMDDTPGYVVAAVLRNRHGRAPYVLMGASANVDPVRAAYRATCEAATIHFLASNGPLLSGEDFIVDEQDFMNLDSNVAYWAKAGDEQRKEEILGRLSQGAVTMSALKSTRGDSDEETVQRLVAQVAQVSRYAVWLDITPLEAQHTGVKVMRVFIPELVQLSHPGCPYTTHPRIQAFGGVTNHVPHPMP